MRSQAEFLPGDIVKYKRDFLRNIGWYTNVPIDGRVTGPSELTSCVVVEWSDGETRIVNRGNLTLKRTVEHG